MNNEPKHKRPRSSGPLHHNWQGGHASNAERDRHSKVSVKLRYLQDLGHHFKFMHGKKTPGRKPKGYIKLNLDDPLHIAYVIKKINED